MRLIFPGGSTSDRGRRAYCGNPLPGARAGRPRSRRPLPCSSCSPSVTSCWARWPSRYDSARSPDGWRRIVGVGLRAEHAKFALTAFALTPPADPPAALARFLRSDPDARFALTHTPRLVTRRRTDAVDVAELTFVPDGSLTGMNLHLDPLLPESTAADRERGVAALVAAYNRTRTLPEQTRPLELDRAVGGDPFARRLLAAACVSF